MARAKAPAAALAALLVATGCSEQTHVELLPGADDGIGGAGGSGGTSVAQTGGTPASAGARGGRGGTLDGGGGANGGAASGGANAAGGASGMGGTTIGAGGGANGGAGGAAPRCNDCWLLADNVEWERFDAFLSDGTELVWQDYDDNVVTMGFDGSNKKTVTLPGCKNPWKGAFLFDGYVYFAELFAATSYGIFRVPAGVAQGTTCEQKYTGPDNALSVFLDAPRNAFWIGSGTASSNVITRMVRVDYPSFLSQTELAQTGATIEAADDAALYGHSNYNVVRYDRATKTLANLNDEIGSARVIAVDDTYVYYLSGTISLKRTPKAGHTSAAPEVVPGPNQPWRIAADGDRVVYWTLGDTHFSSMPLAGGTPTDVSLGAFQIRGLTWDATRWFVMTGPLDGPYKLLRIPR